MSEAPERTKRVKRGSATLSIGPGEMHILGDRFAEPFQRAHEWATEAKAVTDRCGWSADDVRQIAMSWHPGLMDSGEPVYWRAIREHRPLAVKNPADGSPVLYVEWERAAGKLKSGWARIPALNAMADKDARLNFLFVSAALVVDGAYRLAENMDSNDAQHGDFIAWRLLYWIARFHGNLRQVLDAQRSREANKNKATRGPDPDNLQRVLDHYDSIVRSGGRGSIVATIVKRMSYDVAERTVRKYLKAHRPGYAAHRKMR